MQRGLLQGSNRNVCVLCQLRRVATLDGKRQVQSSSRSIWTSGIISSLNARWEPSRAANLRRLRNVAAEVVKEQRRHYDHNNGLTAEESRAREALMRRLAGPQPQITPVSSPRSAHGARPNRPPANNDFLSIFGAQHTSRSPTKHEAAPRNKTGNSGRNARNFRGQESRNDSRRLTGRHLNPQEVRAKDSIFRKVGAPPIGNQSLPIRNVSLPERRLPTKSPHTSSLPTRNVLSSDEESAAEKVLAGIGAQLPEEPPEYSNHTAQSKTIASLAQQPQGETLPGMPQQLQPEPLPQPLRPRTSGLTPEEERAKAALNKFPRELSRLSSQFMNNESWNGSISRQQGQYQYPPPTLPRIKMAADRPKTIDELKIREPPSHWQHIRKRPSGQNDQNLVSRVASNRKPEQYPGSSQGLEDALTGLSLDSDRRRGSYTSFLPNRRQRDSNSEQPFLTQRTATRSALQSGDSHPKEGDAGRTQKWRPPVKSSDADSARSIANSDDFYMRASARDEVSVRSRDNRRESAQVSTFDASAWAEDPRNTRRRKSRESAYDENPKKSKFRKSRRNDNDMDDDILAAREERRRQKAARKKAAKMENPTPITLPEYISVANLATALRVRLDEFIAKLEDLGFEDVQNDHILNHENASLVAMEYNFEPAVQKQDIDLYPMPLPEDPSSLPVRPPVVTIMGHVDHGKTTILDFLRKSAVAASEFGGITQHIGAFSVPLPSGKTITFLDTPGHAAFETMRQRGANVTDIVVLVVAADDSVKPQTVEAIKHAQGARVPIIVAINKIDKPEANPEAVKRDLMVNGIEVEDFGGDVQAINVSGKTGQGLDALEEAIVTLSEILDHRADTTGPVEGWVLEASTKKSGRVATVLVRRGTLRAGGILVAGSTWARVRSLRTEAGVTVSSAGPGTPVEVDGWREQPDAGDEALQASDEQQANDVVEYRQEIIDRERLSKDVEAINESRRLDAEKKAVEKAAEEAASHLDKPEREAQVAAAVSAAATQSEASRGVITVPFIIKADVSGSSEAIFDSISAIGNNEVQALVLRSGVGPVYEFDVEHAAAANGHVINFNTTTPAHVESLAAEKGVKILNHNIIYRLVDEIKSLLSERLPPKIIQRVVGEAEIAQTFSYNYEKRKRMMVAGCKIKNGLIKKEGKVRILRGTEVIHQGIISSLKNVKKDVHEMNKGSECGMAFEKWEDFKVGDHVQHYEEVEEKRTL